MNSTSFSCLQIHFKQLPFYAENSVFVETRKNVPIKIKNVIFINHDLR